MTELTSVKNANDLLAYFLMRTEEPLEFGARVRQPVFDFRNRPIVCKLFGILFDPLPVRLRQVGGDRNVTLVPGKKRFLRIWNLFCGRVLLARCLVHRCS